MIDECAISAPIYAELGTRRRICAYRPRHDGTFIAMLLARNSLFYSIATTEPILIGDHVDIKSFTLFAAEALLSPMRYATRYFAASL